MSRKPEPIAERIEIAKLWKNRRRDKVIVVALNPYEGLNLIDVREHVIGSDGIMRPSTRGVALVVKLLPELAHALAKAERKARELRLIGTEQPADESEAAS
jgi:hypothetical protein